MHARRMEEKVAGICGSYVRNILNTESLHFEKLVELTVKMSDSKPRAYGSFDLFGIQVRAN